MREIIILAAGTGTKMFPYDMVGSKTMRPVAGIPIMGHMVHTLRSFSGAPIHIMTLKKYYGATALYFDGMDGVQVHALDQMCIRDRFRPELDAMRSTSPGAMP